LVVVLLVDVVVVVVVLVPLALAEVFPVVVSVFVSTGPVLFDVLVPFTRSPGGGSGEVVLSCSVAELLLAAFVLLLPLLPPPQAASANTLAETRAIETIFMAELSPVELAPP